MTAVSLRIASSPHFGLDHSVENGLMSARRSRWTGVISSCGTRALSIDVTSLGDNTIQAVRYQLAYSMLRCSSWLANVDHLYYLTIFASSVGLFAGAADFTTSALPRAVLAPP